MKTPILHILRRPVQKNPYLPLVIFGLVLCLATLPLFLTGGRAKTMFSGWKTSPATIIDYATRRSSNNKLLYAPIFQYEVDGVTYQNQSHVSSNDRRKIGHRITIAYNPNSPFDSLEMDGLNMIIYIFIFIGLLMFGFSAYMMFRKKQRRQLIDEARTYGSSYDGYIVDLLPTNIRTNDTPVMDVIIEADVNGETIQTELRLTISEWHLNSYIENPTPIPVYRHPHNPDEFLVDPEDVYAVTDSNFSAFKNMLGSIRDSRRQ